MALMPSRGEAAPSMRQLPTMAKSAGVTASPTKPPAATAANARAARRPTRQGRRHAACNTACAFSGCHRALRAQISTISMRWASSGNIGSKSSMCAMTSRGSAPKRTGGGAERLALRRRRSARWQGNGLASLSATPRHRASSRTRRSASPRKLSESRSCATWSKARLAPALPRAASWAQSASTRSRWRSCNRRAAVSRMSPTMKMSGGQTSSRNPRISRTASSQPTTARF
mmetsp:Transcript_121768/g.339160  ORF Transcript_121768/g.339160 Transcript_121768/m.339160 type:complete len:230 (+) Transcript_121768:192-881(+)